MAYNRRKRKVKKNIPEAQAHISSTYNNTLVTITDKEGNTISWASGLSVPSLPFCSAARYTYLW